MAMRFFIVSDAGGALVSERKTLFSGFVEGGVLFCGEEGAGWFVLRGGYAVGACFAFCVGLFCFFVPDHGLFCVLDGGGLLVLRRRSGGLAVSVLVFCWSFFGCLFFDACWRVFDIRDLLLVLRLALSGRCPFYVI